MGSPNDESGGSNLSCRRRNAAAPAWVHHLRVEVFRFGLRQDGHDGRAGPRYDHGLRWYGQDGETMTDDTSNPLPQAYLRALEIIRIALAFDPARDPEILHAHYKRFLASDLALDAERIACDAVPVENRYMELP